MLEEEALSLWLERLVDVFRLRVCLPRPLSRCSSRALVSASCGLGLEKEKRCAIDSDVMIWSLGSRVGELTVGVDGECKRGVSGATVRADV